MSDPIDIAIVNKLIGPATCNPDPMLIVHTADI